MDRELVPMLSRLVSVVALVIVSVGGLLVAPALSADGVVAADGTASELVTWSCTGSPCPWGDQTAGHAVVWPADLTPIDTRYGYTTSSAIYVPGTTASGYQVTIQSGGATVFAGTPAGPHRAVATIAAGQTATLPVVDADEMLSVQSDNPFTFTLTPGTPPPPPPTQSPEVGTASELVVWSCTSTPCPWGDRTVGHAAVWPAELAPIHTRHGYTTSADIYAPGTTTTGYQVALHTGSATVYAGTPTGTHRVITTLSAGSTTTLPVLDTDEVFSVQSDNPFTYTLTAGAPPPPDPTGSTPPDPTGSASPDPAAGTASQLVVWSCTGSPCPWGDQTTGHAAVWPAGLAPIHTRHGYTTSADIYAPGTTTTGYQVALHTGSATVYAGTPTGTHRVITTLAAGGTTTLPVLDTDEVFSVQSDNPFTYTLTAGAPPPPDPTGSTPPDPTGSASPSPTGSATPSPTGSASADPTAGTASELVVWSCTGSPCPWGDQSTGHAAVWPSDLTPIHTRQGYTTSADIYAPGTTTSGYRVTLRSGSATVYAGLPSGTHRVVTTLAAGDTATLPVVDAGEVFSVQADSPFTYTLTAGVPPPPPCRDPMTCDPVSWTPSFWRCNIPGCTGGGSPGGVVTWPSWSAYESNGRSGASSWTVYDEHGGTLYPYMGPWAEGCQVTVVTGQVLVIEWERGTDLWRETVVSAGETHTIHLVGTENGAMLETPNNTEPFTVSISACTPRTVDKT